MTICKAQQQSDEMFCPTCNLRWDVNDPEPPRCEMAPGGATAWVKGCKCKSYQPDAPDHYRINPNCPVHG